VSVGPAWGRHRVLTAELAAALGLPKLARRAVLTLEVGQPPRMEIEMRVVDARGRPIIEERPGEYGEGVARRLAKVQFMVRLERFPDAKT
jgi:hypothetical protein